MGENNFINSLKFNEDFLPFKKNDEIKFWGETEMKNLIEFYLKNKPENKDISDKEIKENAGRFKINCVLGNNWGGKSRLFEGIYKHIKWWNWTGIQSLDIIPENYRGWIILDDFFKLNFDRDASCNSKLLNDWYDFFYTTLIKFLSKNLESKLFKDFWEIDFTMTYDYNFNKKNDDIFEQINTIYIVYEMFKYLNWNKEIDKWLFRNFEEKESDIKFLLLETNFLEEYINTYLNTKVWISPWTELDYFKTILKVLQEYLKLYELKIDKKNINENINYYLDLPKKWLKKLLPKQAKELENIKENFKNKIFQEFKNFLNKKNTITSVWFQFYFSLEEIKTIEDKFLYNSIFWNNIRFTEVKWWHYWFDWSFYFWNMSSWEKLSYARFSNIYQNIYNNFKNRKYRKFVILIDEPDLHLHLDWQKKYIQKLIDVFSTLDPNIKLHFIIATHSPFIISDLPAESIIILEWEWQEIDWKKYTKIKKYTDISKKSFWANFVDIINDWFFFKDKVLMGSFAETNIKDFSIAQKFLMVWTGNIKEDNLWDKDKSILKFLKENNLKEIEDFKKYIDLIWDDFLKENLLYL